MSPSARTSDGVDLLQNREATALLVMVVQDQLGDVHGCLLASRASHCRTVPGAGRAADPACAVNTVAPVDSLGTRRPGTGPGAVAIMDRSSRDQPSAERGRARLRLGQPALGAARTPAGGRGCRGQRRRRRGAARGRAGRAGRRRVRRVHGRAAGGGRRPGHRQAAGRRPARARHLRRHADPVRGRGGARRDNRRGGLLAGRGAQADRSRPAAHGLERGRMPPRTPACSRASTRTPCFTSCTPTPRRRSRRQAR